MRFFKGDGYFRFIDFSFRFYTLYASMEKERQLSVWSLPIFFFHSCTYISFSPQAASSDFSVIFHRIYLKLAWLIEIVTCSFDDYILGWVGQRSKSQREEIEKKNCVLNFSVIFY